MLGEAAAIGESWRCIHELPGEGKALIRPLPLFSTTRGMTLSFACFNLFNLLFCLFHANCRRLVVVRESDVLLLQPMLEPEEESGGGGGRISRIALLPGEDEEGGGGSRKSTPDPPSPSNGNRTSMSGAVLAAERVTFQAGEPSRVVTLDYWMCRGDRRAPSSMDSSEERNSGSGGCGHRSDELAGEPSAAS